MAAFDVYSKTQSNLIYMSSHQILLRVTVGDFGTLVGFIGQIWDVWGLSLFAVPKKILRDLTKNSGHD